MTGIVILSAILIAIIYGATHISRQPNKQHSKSNYQKLLQRVLGDTALAERLIAVEAEKHPNAERAVLVRYALQRLERDNR